MTKSTGDHEQLPRRVHIMRCKGDSKEGSLAQEKTLPALTWSAQAMVHPSEHQQTSEASSSQGEGRWDSVPEPGFGLTLRLRCEQNPVPNSGHSVQTVATQRLEKTLLYSDSCCTQASASLANLDASRHWRGLRGQTADCGKIQF